MTTVHETQALSFCWLSASTIGGSLLDSASFLHLFIVVVAVGTAWLNWTQCLALVPCRGCCCCTHWCVSLRPSDLARRARSQGGNVQYLFPYAHMPPHCITYNEKPSWLFFFGAYSLIPFQFRLLLPSKSRLVEELEYVWTTLSRCNLHYFLHLKPRFPRGLPFSLDRRRVREVLQSTKLPRHRRCSSYRPQPSLNHRGSSKFRHCHEYCRQRGNCQYCNL